MKIKMFLISLLCFTLLSGCKKEHFQVATTVYPIQYLVERIAGTYSNLSVETISENSMIQRAQIKDNYTSILKNSDALFYIGGLEPYMNMYMEDIRENDIDMVDLATKSAIYKFERYTSTVVNGQTTGVETPYYDGELFQTIETYDYDPLLWMDPVAMTSMASDILEYLNAKYPQYRSIFDDNYNKLELDLARLDADFQKISTANENISFVSMTPSFGNWQKSYGIEVYPSVLSKYGALPTADQLEVMKKRIKDDHVRYIAMEDNLPEDMVKLRKKLIDELGLIPVNLKNLSSLSKEDEEAGKDYLSIMYENLETLEAIAS